MDHNQDKLNQLLEKITSLADKQLLFQQEINHLKQELLLLKETPASEKEEGLLKQPQIVAKQEPQQSTALDFKKPLNKPSAIQDDIFNTPPKKPLLSPEFKADFEKFLGENLINKIGIAITVLGVGIGAKYAIDNQLISPLTRIILGYLMGLGLLGFAIKLKASYLNFSAVLLSGAMAILYFITYAAYDFYGLLPQPFAFAIMVLFTGFTVFAAIKYNTTVIAHFGLVGAYAVPFLLSEGEGKVGVLFSYMAIINSGILFLAFKKYWKSLNYVAFALTWLIYSVWYGASYDAGAQFSLALLFLTLFFAIFYLAFLAYKVIRAERFEIGDVFLLILNSFIFYGLGYFIIEEHEVGAQLLGLFTLGNAIIHFCVAWFLFKKKLADRNLFYLLAGLVLVFITIAIPVQLDGNWVTLLWSGLALLLFWIGRKNKVPIYEMLAFPLLVLAFFSLIQDWAVYDRYNIEYDKTAFTPLLNIHFLTSLIFLAVFFSTSIFLFRLCLPV